MTVYKISISEAIKNFDKITDDIVDHNDHVLITKPNNRKVIIFSESEYESYKETMYLLATKNNRKDLAESLSQLNNIKIKTISKDDWDKASHKN